MARSFTKHRRADVDEFDRKLRRFNESLAHRERRILRELIESALQDDDDDTGGYAQLTDEQLFAALARVLARDAARESVAAT
jgi:hypothetical protein